MKMEQTECSETSAYKIQTPGNYPEESIQHIHHTYNYFKPPVVKTALGKIEFGDDTVCLL